MIRADQRQHLTDHGWCVVEGVLDADEALKIRQTLVDAAEKYRQVGGDTYMPDLDPNAANIRVFNLLELHATFRELILHAEAVALVQALLGEHYRISNFTANIALPGSRSMAMHSDQAFVAPAPWLTPWSMNIIWCLDDVHEGNGATRYIPDSHRCQTVADLPADPYEASRPFEAPRGSIIAMDGRVWHTSGANTTTAEERALLFGYYSLDFVRPQVNWNAILSPATQAQVSEELAYRLVLGPESNTRLAGEIMARDVAGLRPDLNSPVS